MNNNLRELAKLIRFARKNGLKSLKFNGIEFELSATYTPPARKSKTLGDPITTTERPPTDDEFLFWSTESFDAMRADRENGFKEKN